MSALFTLNGKNAIQARGLAPKTYARAKALATDLKAQITLGEHGFLTVTCSSKKIAQQFVDTLTTEYANTKLEVTPKTQPTARTSKPTSAKGSAKTLSDYSTKALKAELTKRENAQNTASAPVKNGKKSAPKKSTLEDFIKAHPLCTREEATAHGFKGTKPELRALKVKVLGK